MSEVSPPWQPFDPSRPFVNESPVVSDSGLFVLLGSEAGHEQGWAADLALAVAAQAASRGRETSVYDLAVERPRLHRVAIAPAGDAGGEGVTDLVRYGASHERVEKKLADGFYLIPAGTVDPDPAEILSEGDLVDLVRSRAGETDRAALLYVPAGAPAVAALAAEVGRVVWLAREDEAPPPWLEDGPARIVARWGPASDPTAPAPTAPAPMAPVPTADDAGREADGSTIEPEPEWPEFGEPLVVADPDEIDPAVAAHPDLEDRPALGDFGADVGTDRLGDTDDGSFEVDRLAAALPAADDLQIHPEPGSEEPPPLAARVPEVARTVRRDRKRPRAFLLILFALFILTIAVLAWAGYVEFPAIDWFRGDPS